MLFQYICSISTSHENMKNLNVKPEMSSSCELGSSSIKISINIMKVKCEYIGEYSYLAS
jgi:hypothetical protein